MVIYPRWIYPTFEQPAGPAQEISFELSNQTEMELHHQDNC